MAFLVGWMLVLLLLAFWSSLVWAAESLLAALLTNAGSVDVGGWNLPEPLTAALPAGLADWLVSTIETLMPQLQSLASMLPSLSSWVGVLAWLVWGAGALALFVVGVAVHVGVALWRKSRRSSLQLT